MRKFECDYLEAENKKIEEGIKSLDGESKKTDEESNTDAVMPGIMIEEKTIFNELVEEIRKTLRFYMKNNNNAFFNTFIGAIIGVFLSIIVKSASFPTLIFPLLFSSNPP